MDVCLMVEGQEDVTWEDWLALAAACEEHGVGTMFRSGSERESVKTPLEEDFLRTRARQALPSRRSPAARCPRGRRGRGPARVRGTRRRKSRTGPARSSA